MNESIAKLLLRLALGGAILLHGIAKLTGGIGGIAGMVSAAGLPSFLAYGVYVGEVIAPCWSCWAGIRGSALHSSRSIWWSQSALLIAASYSL